MLRMYLMQNWFNLSDAGIEDAVYDSYAMRSFMHIDFLNEQVPDETTLLKFRHLLEAHDIGKKIFADVNERLEKARLIMHGGTIVDATIIAAPSSTKNETASLIRPDSEVIYSDSGYLGIEKHLLIVKKQFGYCKAAYKGIAKNINRFNILFASANLLMCVRAGLSKEFCMG